MSRRDPMAAAHDRADRVVRHGIKEWTGSIEKYVRMLLRQRSLDADERDRLRKWLHETEAWTLAVLDSQDVGEPPPLPFDLDDDDGGASQV